MQDKEAEALRNQRRRRKRIGRIKSAIVVIIAGWIVISMVLIICLFVKVSWMERSLNSYIQLQNRIDATDTAEPPADSSGDESVDGSSTEVSEVMNYAAPPVTMVTDEDNLATAGDIHKVYLTFDDGPSENTNAILDILAEHDVKATFFVVGREDDESKEAYQRIVDEGHTLGMHSYSNKYSVIYQSKDAFVSDYQKLHDYLLEVTGVDSRYYRFPGGSSNQISNVPMADLIAYLDEQNVVYYDWNVTSGDAATTAFGTEEIVEKVTEDVVKYKTSVVLLHDADDKQATVDALAPLIEALEAMDAELLPIDDDTQAIQYVRLDSAE